MRHLALWISLLCILSLSACGNANDGKAFTPHRTQSTSALTGSPAASPSLIARTLYCRSPFTVIGDNDFYSQFASTELCPGAGPVNNEKSSLARVKVSAFFPVNARLCLVPFVGSTPSGETCFSINGQIDIPVSTNQYTSAALVLESDLAAYKSYLNSSADSGPKRVIFSL